MDEVQVNPIAVLSSAFDQPNVGFVLIAEGQKFPPIEEGWQKPENAHSFQEATEHVAKGGNVGIMANYGYLGLDLDDPTAFSGLKLPGTTQWETRPGRYGLWFVCTDSKTDALAKYGKKADQAQLKLYDSRRIIDGKYPAVGEVKLERTYQVIPPSWKELEGRTIDYKMVQDIPPAQIELRWLLSELSRLGITFSEKPKKTTAKGKGKKRRYAETALAGEVEKVQNAPKGDRNNQLFKSAAVLGELIAAGSLFKEEVIEALEAVAEDDEPEKILSTIKSGIESGMKNPRKPPKSKSCNCCESSEEEEPIDETIKAIASGIIARGKAFDYIYQYGRNE